MGEPCRSSKRQGNLGQTSFAGIIDGLDKAGNVNCDIVEGLAGHQIDGLDLQLFHEALGLGIVVGIATTPHRTGTDEPRSSGRARQCIASGSGVMNAFPLRDDLLNGEIFYLLRKARMY